MLSGSRLVAEDLAQEGSWPPGGSGDGSAGTTQPAAWVRRVVANLAASTVRRRLAEVRAVARLMVGWQPDVEELSEASAEVWRAIRALPRQQAQAMAMYYLLGCSVGEIATVLDRSERSVKAYLHDGRDAVGRRLGLDVEELG